MSVDFFKGRKLVIATMHAKEQVMASVLERELGVAVVIGSDINTDQLGTFSGEIERTMDPLEAAREKCRLAGGQYNCSLVIASEGSFGPHPAMHFVPADDEIVLLLDLEHNLEFKARELSTETNFNGALLTSWREVTDFARAARFPSHALIVRKDKEDIQFMTKGITSHDVLEEKVIHLLGTYGQVYIETDMRAMHNPLRMQVIERATAKLAKLVNTACPACNTPGFSVVDVRVGLPCEACGAPTGSTHAHVYGCQRCEHRDVRLFPHGKQTESPMFCNWCNP